MDKTIEKMVQTKLLYYTGAPILVKLSCFDGILLSWDLVLFFNFLKLDKGYRHDRAGCFAIIYCRYK
jgi:hypothetical protein